MSQWRWTLVEEFKNGTVHTEQHSGQQPDLRDAMNDVANTVEYLLEVKDQYKKHKQHKTSQLDEHCIQMGPGLR